MNGGAILASTHTHSLEGWIILFYDMAAGSRFRAAAAWSSSLQSSRRAFSARTPSRRRLEFAASLRDFTPHEGTADVGETNLPPYLTSAQLDGAGAASTPPLHRE